MSTEDLVLLQCTLIFFFFFFLISFYLCIRGGARHFSLLSLPFFSNKTQLSGSFNGSLELTGRCCLCIPGICYWL